MRAAVLFGLVLLVGAFVGGVWWWTSETRDAQLPEGVARRMATDYAAASAAPEAAPSTPIGAAPSDSAEPRRTSVHEPDYAKRDGPEAPPSRSLLVHVVDAETRAEIADVSVIRAESLNTVTEDGRVVDQTPVYAVEHARSPVAIAPSEPDALTRGRETFTFWFCAAGYVRTFERLDFLDRSERTVALSPAASLVVVVRGVLPEVPPSPAVRGQAIGPFGWIATSGVHDREPKLRLRRKRDGYIASGSVAEEFGIEFAEKTASIGETLYDEVLPGDLVASVEIGASHRLPTVLATQSVHVVARETARVVLDVAPAAVPTLAQLAGTLRVPPGASIESFALEVSPRGLRGAIASDWRTLDAKSMEPVAGRNDTWRWDAGELPSGTYSITIHGASITKVVELPPRGATDVALEVPTHATLRVRVVSSRDGSPVKLSWLDWTPAWEEGAATGVSPILLLYDEATHTFASSVPIGRGELESFGADPWALDEAVRAEIFPGEQELVARVHPIGGASLVLACDGKALEMERRLVDAITVAPVGGSGRCVWKRLRDRLPAFAADPPGRYLVTLPTVPGYEPVAPFEVDVVVGTFAKLPIELRRE
jgi:hypothetical protein